MTRNSNESEIEELSEYNISDFLFPLKAVRHLRKISGIKDPVVRYYETGFNAIVIASNLIACEMLYKLLQ